MTPAQILSLIRDIAVLLALGFVVWRIYEDGEDRVTLADMRAVQAQVVKNTQVVSGWQKEASDAEGKRNEEMAAISTAIAAQRTSVIVQPTAPACHASPVPNTPAAPASSPPASGGFDIRPRINAFELKYEKALSDCRSVLAQWPR